MDGSGRKKAGSLLTAFVQEKQRRVEMCRGKNPVALSSNGRICLTDLGRKVSLWSGLFIFREAGEVWLHKIFGVRRFGTESQAQLC